MSKEWKCADCCCFGTDACHFPSMEEHYIACEHLVVDHNKAYQEARAEELDKISKMILLGCGEMKCEECEYKEYSQDICQQAYTLGVIESYIEEQLKEQDDK